MRKIAYPLVAIIVGLFLYLLGGTGPTPVKSPQDIRPAGQPVPGKEVVNNFVVDINVHSLSELREILQRAEQLVNQPRPANEPANIALMLHGPEVDFFRIDEYSNNKEIVDLAARLDAYNAVEVKMCETMMRSRGIDKNNVPGFIELVPDGENEIEKLKGRGYEVL